MVCRPLNFIKPPIFASQQLRVGVYGEAGNGLRVRHEACTYRGGSPHEKAVGLPHLAASFGPKEECI